MTLVKGHVNDNLSTANFTFCMMQNPWSICVVRKLMSHYAQNKDLKVKELARFQFYRLTV